MSQEFTDKTQQKIESYIMHSMPEDEINSFEERMDNDDLLKQEVLLQKSIHQAFNENDWDSQKNLNSEEVQKLTKELRSDKYKKASEGINDVAGAYFKNMEAKVTQKNRFSFYKMAIAATILLLICVPFFLTQNSLGSQYESLAHWDDIPSFIEKGEPNDLVNKGENLFRLEKYNEVIELYGSSKKLDAYSLMYLGASHVKLNNTDKALKFFDQLIATGSIEHSRGYWYKLLVYLKTENEDKVKEMLAIILSSEDNYNYKEALLLSEDY